VEGRNGMKEKGNERWSAMRKQSNRMEWKKWKED
jgi:hypothetical protein